MRKARASVQRTATRARVNAPQHSSRSRARAVGTERPPRRAAGVPARRLCYPAAGRASMLCQWTGMVLGWLGGAPSASSAGASIPS